MKLSKETRNSIYKYIYFHRLLATEGICLVMELAFAEHELTGEGYEGSRNKFNVLPELNVYCEQYPWGEFWFPLTSKGYQQRRELLEHCIAQTEHYAVTDQP